MPEPAANAGRQDRAQEFLKAALDCDALSFGNFMLKSERLSPYFMNVGRMATAAAAATLGRLYASCALEISTSAVLLGLPYKGIPLAALACAYAPEQDDKAIYSYAYLRKDVKDHGEGGALVGQMDYNRDDVVLIDDVLTAGTALISSLKILESMHIEPKAALIAFDRQERTSETDARSATKMLEEDHGLTVHAIACASDLLEVPELRPDEAKMIRAHLDKQAPAG